MPEFKAALPVAPAKAGVQGSWSYVPDAAGWIPYRAHCRHSGQRFLLVPYVPSVLTVLLRCNSGHGSGLVPSFRSRHLRGHRGEAFTCKSSIARQSTPYKLTICNIANKYQGEIDRVRILTYAQSMVRSSPRRFRALHQNRLGRKEAFTALLSYLRLRLYPRGPGLPTNVIIPP